jgi:hypothetical protein
VVADKKKKKKFCYNSNDDKLGAQKQRAKTRTKSEVKAAPGSSRVSKKRPHFFGNRKLPASKNIQKTGRETCQKIAKNPQRETP